MPLHIFCLSSGSGARSSALIHAACSRIDRISAHLSVLVQILTIGRPLHMVSGSHALIRLAKQMSAQTNSGGSGSTDENDAVDFGASPHASLLVHHSACLRDELRHASDGGNNSTNSIASI